MPADTHNVTVNVAVTSHPLWAVLGHTLVTFRYEQLRNVLERCRARDGSCEQLKALSLKRVSWNKMREILSTTNVSCGIALVQSRGHLPRRSRGNVQWRSAVPLPGDRQSIWWAVRGTDRPYLHSSQSQRSRVMDC
jgi:hypothetical protein